MLPALATTGPMSITMDHSRIRSGMTDDYSDGIYEEDGLIIERKGKWARVVGKNISDGELLNRILDREFKKLRND